VTFKLSLMIFVNLIHVYVFFIKILRFNSCGHLCICSGTNVVHSHELQRVVIGPSNNCLFSGGRHEASKHNLNFQGATWHHF